MARESWWRFMSLSGLFRLRMPIYRYEECGLETDFVVESEALK